MTMRDGVGSDRQGQGSLGEEDLCGIGLGFFPDDSGRFMVTAVSPYTQARQCGVRAGDQIVKIDGEAIDEEDPLKVFRRVFDRKGSEVTLLFRSSSDLERMVTLKRQLNSLTTQSLQDAYSGLPGVLMDCGDWEKAMEYLREDMRVAMANEDMKAAAVFSCQMGMVRRQLGKMEEASQNFQDAMNMARTAGDQRTEVVAFERMIATLIESSGGAGSLDDGDGEIEGERMKMMSASEGQEEVKRKSEGFCRLYSRVGASMMQLQGHLNMKGMSSRLSSAGNRTVLSVMVGDSGGLDLSEASKVREFVDWLKELDEVDFAEIPRRLQSVSSRAMQQLTEEAGVSLVCVGSSNRRSFFIGLRRQEENFHRSVLVARGRLRRRTAMRSGAKGFMRRSEQVEAASEEEEAITNVIETLKGGQGSRILDVSNLSAIKRLRILLIPRIKPTLKRKLADKRVRPRTLGQQTKDKRYVIRRNDR
ncbi:hypothetical protein GUITHDRAFT_105111 [Guillardia theta CCMP2712]|uniref:PDZ domain-containing protein n=1 Tax=Guillardia theta (strain CCMP2712) TaxID=905079 RepID=L1JLM7_GUITC|nr:hypothetical protein GUITHDRAFT_105111 [Guillardia theta CCMP2712]EKX49030.1 hypothetical protein GUITHDRAFT_105111 [Guillardia theta CCMP2712]|eukprot:XP_005836010.1 hypothetical protein GUITHDRAFT_105111 [Guillardia theta CCMP2712]